MSFLCKSYFGQVLSSGSRGTLGMRQGRGGRVSRTSQSPCSAPQTFPESCRCAPLSVSIKVIFGQRLTQAAQLDDLVLSRKERKERKAYRDGGV